MAAQDDCVVGLHRGAAPTLHHLPPTSCMLPPPRAGLGFEQHRDIVVPCGHTGS